MCARIKVDLEAIKRRRRRRSLARKPPPKLVELMLRTCRWGRGNVTIYLLSAGCYMCLVVSPLLERKTPKSILRGARTVVVRSVGGRSRISESRRPGGTWFCHSNLYSHSGSSVRMC